MESSKVGVLEKGAKPKLFRALRKQSFNKNSFESHFQADIQLYNEDEKFQINVPIIENHIESFGHHFPQPTAEQICQDISNKIGILPLLSHLFGLQLMSKDGKSVWIQPQQSLGLLPLNRGNELHYRIRYIPNKDCIHKLAKLNIRAFEYLYYQLKFDMVHEQFSTGVKEREDLEKFFRGLAVIDMLISLRLKPGNGNDNEENVAHVLKNIDQYLPPSLCCKNIFDRIFRPLETEMTRKLEEVRREYTPEKYNAHSLMMNNVGFLLASIPSVYIETYETFKFSIIRHATEREGVTKVKFQRKTKILLTLDFRSEENQPPSLQLGEVNSYTGKEDTQLKYHLFNLLGLSFTKVESDTETWWKVNINLRMGQDQVVYFRHESDCLSFLTMVEGYCRLCYDHYHSLCEDVAPTMFKEMMALKAHGPISKMYAGQKLWNPRYMNEDFYILRQNPKMCDQYDLLMRGTQPQGINTLSLGVITRNNGMYKLAAEGYKGYRSIKELVFCKIRDMREDYHIPSVMKLPYSGECCDDLYELLLGKVMTFDPQNSNERSDKKAVPEVINASDIEYLDKLGKGEFTEVSKARLKKHGSVAVKQLSVSSTVECERYKFHEALLRGFQTSLLLNVEPRFFITFYGLSLTSPTMMVMKYAALGSFADLLRSRQSNDPISIDDRLEACTQVARGLLYMEENTIVHGSLCCKNLMAFQQKDGEITVKIADPGLVHLYNQLSLDHNVNMKRLPWLAVELYDDMTKVTMETDLYAYGVLIWEIMSDAEHPLDKPPLKNMSYDERKEHFKSGFTLGIPSLLELDKIQQDGQNLQQTQTSVNRGKIKMREIMEQCWDRIWSKRPRPKQLLRELYLVMQAYGVYSNYHYGSSGESSHYYYAQDGLPTDKNESHIHNARKEAQQDPEMYVQNKDFIAHPQMQNYSKISTIPIQHQGHNADWQPDGKEIHSPLSNQSLQENQLSDLQNSGQVALVEPNQCTSPILFIQTQFRLLPAIVPQDDFTTVSGHFLSSHQVSSTGRTKSAKKEMPFINADIVKINYEDKLGKGSFGSVYSGEIDGKLKVAIKLLERVPNNIQTSIKQEAMVMTGLSHENIVRFHGLCIKDNCLVMEYVAGGCVQAFLKKNEKKIPAHHLSRFCIEICQGMEYLYLEKIVHCDLATKNVLLTENNLNGTVKIADFGLARTVAKDKDYYRRKTETSMPLWSAPEYHHSQTFSFKADIWSCGTTFWEVYSFGRVPELRDLNIHFSAHKVNSFGKNQGQKLLNIYLSIMKTGEWLPEPDNCPDWMYRVMLDCWEYDPDQRPDIMTLLTRLKRLKENPILMENISPSSSADTTSDKQSVHISTNEISGTALLAKDTEKKTTLSDKYIYRLSNLIIPDDIIQIQETIGEGNFGQVKRGILDGKTVAIKCLKTNLSGGDDAKRFLREIELLHKASHPNIVPLLGILKGQMDLFVMEYLENGNLRDYLISQKKKGTLPKQMELLRILKDISAGMEYLTSINILHGDLTASNILLTSDLQAKVSDFGLGKIFNEVPYQRSEKAKFHYKWCAPEVLKYRTFNKTSDVWSYGVLLWEVFTYGEEPNYGDSFSATSRNPQYRFTEKVLNDVKLPKPANCPNTVYQDIMIKCWAMKSENRPLFSHIKEKLLSNLEKMNE